MLCWLVCCLGCLCLLPSLSLSPHPVLTLAVSLLDSLLSCLVVCQTNQSLTWLNVAANDIGAEGARHFGDVLKVRSSTLRVSFVIRASCVCVCLVVCLSTVLDPCSLICSVVCLELANTNCLCSPLDWIVSACCNSVVSGQSHSEGD